LTSSEELYHKITALITHVVNAVNKTVKLQKDTLALKIAELVEVCIQKNKLPSTLASQRVGGRGCVLFFKLV